jgi:preprotein translocase subunit SecD
MFKKDSNKLILITILTSISILIALPRIDIKYENQYFKIDSFIGGYKLNIPFINKVADFSELKKGLDIKGGVRLVVKLDTSGLKSTERDAAISSVKDIITRRVNLFGVSETNIISSKVGNEDRIIIEIPGQDDLDRAAKTIGSTAQLKFKYLDKSIKWPITDFKEIEGKEIFLDSGVTGKDLVSADVSFDPKTNNPLIQLKFTNEGREKFSKLLKENIERPIGIFLDDEILQTPVVSKELANTPVFDPTITGVSLEEAKSISSLLRAGALPVPIEIISQNLIGPTLGADSVQTSLLAGFIGLAIISIFLIINYGRLGLIANISLVMYVSITLALFKLSYLIFPSPIVLTLPGIAGFIFSIGVACDACILIFERIKEEIRWGRPTQIAIINGYERAWSSIKDSNLTTLLTAFILMQFGTGFIKGFALTLSIGIFISILTCVYFSRVIVNVFIKDLKVDK